MQLYDLRLKFARDLIGHWLDIRRGALVPLEADLDPRALVHCLDSVGIIDLTHSPKLIVDLAAAVLRHRFGREIAHMNWIELVPPTLGNGGQRARERIRHVPCGFYHKFTVARHGADALTAETLVLPLRRRNATLPHVVIGMTRDVTARTPTSWLTPSAHVADYFMEFVDIQ